MTELLNDLTTYPADVTVEVNPLISDAAEEELAKLPRGSAIYYNADGFGAIVATPGTHMVSIFTTCGCCTHTQHLNAEER